VPADGFYEWAKLPGSRKQPMRIIADGGKPFFFAGLWQKFVKAIKKGEEQDTDLPDEPPPSQTVEAFTILTRAANDFMAPIHSRMPLMLQDSVHFDWWLDPRGEAADLVLTLPAPPLQAYAVSPLVNSVRNDVPECIRNLDQPYREK